MQQYSTFYHLNCHMCTPFIVNVTVWLYLLVPSVSVFSLTFVFLFEQIHHICGMIEPNNNTKQSIGSENSWKEKGQMKITQWKQRWFFCVCAYKYMRIIYTHTKCICSLYWKIFTVVIKWWIEWWRMLVKVKERMRFGTIERNTNNRQTKIVITKKNEA